MYAVLTLSAVLVLATGTLLVSPGESINDAIVASRSTWAHTVLLRQGAHRLSAPITLTAADSGLTLRAEAGVVLDGGVTLPPFIPNADGVWVTPLPDELRGSKGGLSALYINGERRLRARAPNALGGPPWAFPSLFGDASTLHVAAPLEPCSQPQFGNCPQIDGTGFFANSNESGWPTNATSGALDGALICIASAWLWNWARVASITTLPGSAGNQSTVKFAAPVRDPVGEYGTTLDSPAGGRFFFEDARALLDSPGEFFVDYATSTVLYVPLPNEVPSNVSAVMPNLTTLVNIFGTAAEPVANVTIEGVHLQHFGEACPDGPPCNARLGYWAYTAGVEVGPYAANTTLRNVTVSRGVTDGVGVNSNVSGITITRSTILDVGGKGVGALGALATAEQSVTGFMVANTTITHVGFVFSGGACAVMPVGNGARVLNNDLSDTTYAGVSMQGPGGSSRDEAPTLDIAYNRIYNFGQGITSDFGGVYVSTNSDKVASTNWLAANVHYNWISDSRSYQGGYGANGLYTDHGTSGVAFYQNIVEGLGGRGASLHCGKGIVFVGNLVYNVSLDNFYGNNGALSSCNGQDLTDPGFAANVSANIMMPVGTINAWSPQDVAWKPPTCSVSGDDNVYFAGAGKAMVFPGGSLAQWVQLSGADEHSVEADPQLKDPIHGDFTVLPTSPAWALGWQAIDQSLIGVIPL